MEELNDSLKFGNPSLTNNNKNGSIISSYKQPYPVRSCYEISNLRDKKLSSPCRVKIVPLTQENVCFLTSKWSTYSNKKPKFEENKNTVPRNNLKQNVNDELSISSSQNSESSSSSDESKSNEMSSVSSHSENNFEFDDIINEAKTSSMIEKPDYISSSDESPKNEVKSKKVNSEARTSNIKEKSEDDTTSENCIQISDMSKADKVNRETRTSDKKSESDEVESSENSSQFSDVSESVANDFRDENLNFETSGSNFCKSNSISIENNKHYKKKNSYDKIRPDEINLKTTLNGYTKFPYILQKTYTPIKAVVQNNPITESFTFKKPVTGDLGRNKTANTSTFFQQRNVTVESNEDSDQEESISKQDSTGDCIINEVEPSSSMVVNNDDDNGLDDALSIFAETLGLVAIFIKL